MANLTLREVGQTAVNRPLSNTEIDTNLINLNADIATRIPASEKGAVNGVATLGSDGKVPSSQLPSLDYVLNSAKGAVNGVATLGSDGKVPAIQLPSYVDDVVEAANLAAFPATGETGKIYVALDTNKTYRWSGSVYIYITSGAVDSVAGKTGVVSLVKGDVGLGSVDNTADSAKNVLSATRLTTSRTIGGVSFDGSANINLPGVNATGNQNTTGTAANVTGTVAIANGGTGATTRQEAMDVLAGAVTSGQYLRGNGTDVVMSAIQAADVPTLNQNTTGTAANVTGIVAVVNGGTGANNAPSARTNLGATTLGSNLFTLANVAAIAFPRINADNTVSSLSAADFRTAIGAGTSSTTGTVTSVGGTGTVSGLTLTGTVTGSGNLTLGGAITGFLPTTGGTLSGTLRFGDSTNGLYLSSGRLTVRSESADNVANFAAYGLYLPVLSQTAGLYVESPIEARTGLRMGSGAANGTITVGADTGVVANRIVQRDGNGYIYANHINFNTSETENPTISSFITGNGDGWSRKSSLAHVKNQIRGVADGTWSINITGNAATATTADQIDSWPFRNTGSNSGVNADTIESNGITYYTAGVPNFTGNSSDGALYSQAYSSSWQHQIAADYRSGQIALRGKNSGTWQSWRTVLDSGNYTSYSPSLTGSGASGSWGISVTGSANSLNLSGHSISNSSWAGGGGYHGYQFNGGNWRFGFSSTGGVVDVYADGNFYATDSSHLVLHAGNFSSYAINRGGDTVGGVIQFQMNRAGRSGSTDTAGLQAYSTGNNSAFMSFHKGGHYAVNMGLDDDNVIRIGGWSAAANRWQLDMSGNGTYAGNVTAYSDERLKKDWAPVAANFVRRLATVKSGTYTRIDNNERQAGSSAQDWLKLLPEVVIVNNDEDKTLALAYGNAALVSAVELAKDNVELRARIERLEILINTLLNKE